MNTDNLTHDEARLRDGLHTIGAAIEATDDHGTVIAMPDRRPHRYLAAAAVVALLAAAGTGVAALTQPDGSQTVAATPGAKASPEAPSTPADGTDAMAIASDLIPRIEAATGASFADDAVSKAGADRAAGLTQRVPAIRDYIREMNANAANGPVTADDLLIVPGTTQDGMRLLLIVLVPAAEQVQSAGEDRPAFGFGEYQRTDLNGATQWVASRPEATWTTDIEVHTSLSVIGFRVESHSVLSSNQIEALTTSVLAENTPASDDSGTACLYTALTNDQIQSGATMEEPVCMDVEVARVLGYVTHGDG